MKKIGIYSPYPETLGGGERYIMSIAECLSQAGHQVDVFWDNQEIKKKLSERFDLDLTKVDFVPNIFSLPFWRKTKKMKEYEVLFFVSDGSLSFMGAKKNFVHFQVPFTGVNGQNFLNKLKLKRINRFFCNSSFTKNFIDREFGVNSSVIYPPVPVLGLKPLKKEKMILSVGRLGEPLHSKKQEILLEVFKEMLQSDKKDLLKDWLLVFVVALKPEHQPILEQLKKEAVGFPVKFFVNLNYEKLKYFYGRAKIFWHAAGFGENEKIHPEKVEHFGMVAVEAMAAGAVPVVINKGGLSESVSDGMNGLLWQTKNQLSEATIKLIRSKTLWEGLSRRAIKDSQKFSKEVFCKKIKELIN